MAKFDYVRGSDLSAAELIQGVLDGTLEKWRNGVDGVWYKRRVWPVVKGVPSPEKKPYEFEVDDLDDPDEAEQVRRATELHGVVDSPCIVRDTEGNVIEGDFPRSMFLTGGADVDTSVDE